MASTAAAPDAQKLIALSFGKIQAARGRRGGVNLHKNLLVAGVIIKARSAYIMGIRHPMVEESQPESVSEEKEEGGDCTDSAICTEEDSDPSPPTTEVSEPGLDTEQQPDDSCLDCDKENDRPVVEVEEDKESSESVSCRRCTKRRYTEDSCDRTEAVEVTKKARVCQSLDSNNTVDSSTQCEPEPMQTDNAQISSLVHRFNSGLTGFLSCQNGQNQTVTSSSSDSECNTSKDSHSVSCSTQIKEAFETLARPVVCALGV